MKKYALDGLSFWYFLNFEGTVVVPFLRNGYNERFSDRESASVSSDSGTSSIVTLLSHGQSSADAPANCAPCDEVSQTTSFEGPSLSPFTVDAQKFSR